MSKLPETVFFANLSAKTGTPLKDQLYSQLRKAVLTGKLAPGTRLPASRQLAAQHSVSRNTILAAYEQMVAEGYMETRQGAGTYVSTQVPDYFTEPAQTKPQQGSATQAMPTVSKNTYPDFTLRSGAPALDQFPLDLWARLTSSAWRTAGAHTLMHDDLAGYAPLRRAIASYLKASRSVEAGPDQILIFSGLQQGFKIAAECLLAKGDAVILENPGYHGMAQVAATLQQETLFTAVDNNGAIPPTTTKRGMLVISPSRQYPLGMTMPLHRRLKLLNWAQETSSYILEDDYDSEFRYSGRPLNSLQGIDGGKHVIYGGTFSKSVFPALRLGYLVVPAGLVPKFITHRAAVDSYPSIVPQIALASFMESGHFARHIRKLRKTHARRKHIFTNAFPTYLGAYLDLEPSDAGLHMVARLKASLLPEICTRHDPVPPDVSIAKLAQNIGIGAFALSGTYRYQKTGNTHSDGQTSGVELRTHHQGILLGFANLPDDQIEPLLARFAQALEKKIN
ncbi:MAG: PLP-dependent aminotransferase family protein [Kordiimonadaceae bacterium]|nr:PLP-dependent aminotransferase family protein [Kordiimonadaceae bacterium]